MCSAQMHPLPLCGSHFGHCNSGFKKREISSLAQTWATLASHGDFKSNHRFCQVQAGLEALTLMVEGPPLGQESPPDHGEVCDHQALQQVSLEVEFSLAVRAKLSGTLVSATSFCH